MTISNGLLATGVRHFLLIGTITAVSAASLEAEVVYERDIKPVLRNKCWSCHSALKQEAELRLDAGSLVHASGVVEPNSPEKSELWLRIQASDEAERMPPEGSPLTSDEIEAIASWITAGAPYPSDEVIPAAPEQHWSFQPIRRPPVPPVPVADVAGRPLNPIDAFVLARLERQGKQPSPAAGPGQLLRRLHLDLTGLPPTIAEQDQFVANPDVEMVVDDLLSRVGYGERYARHWLDVVRYADSNGYERDAAKPEVWRYRDYVIRSLNQDKPFDRFLAEQIAGDELPDATTETVIATGLHRLGPWDDEPADPELDRFDQLDDVVNTVSQAFLGLTAGCARCHDHKFDPILQTDYYSLVAIFAPLERPRNGRQEETRYAAPPQLAAQLVERDRQLTQKEAEIRSLIDDWAADLVQSGKSSLSDQLKQAIMAGDSRTGEQKELLRKSHSEIRADVESHLSNIQRSQLAELQSRIQQLKAELPDVPQGYFMVERAGKPHVTHLLKRGNPQTPGPVVPPAAPAFLVRKQPWKLLLDEATAASNETTGRRLALARWMIQPDNPLTARVIVNRVWQWHFGAGLVRTPNDMGLIGERPTHPELLDWLAHWFIHEADWSLKELHRLIVTSRTYQQSSLARADMMQLDPENRLLWRHVPHRLEVEAIRDSMLFVSGRLDRRMYGPAMHPFVPEEALLNHADKTSIWPAYDEAAASRRTIYAFIKRSLVVPFLEVLDLCDVTQTSPQRKVTTVPTQALTLYNGQFAMRQAEHFADRILREAGDSPEAQIELAYRLALSRSPRPRERTAMLAFLNSQLAARPASTTPESATEAATPAAAHRDLADQADQAPASKKPVDSSQAHRRALTQLCRVIFNINEFVYPE